MLPVVYLFSVDLCPLDSASVPLCREGTSLMHLIEDPKREDWKQRIFSQVDRNGKVRIVLKCILDTYIFFVVNLSHQS